MSNKVIVLFFALFVLLAGTMCLTSGCAKPDVQAGIIAHDREQATYNQTFDLQRRMLRKAQFDVAYAQMTDEKSRQALITYAEERDKGEFLTEQNERTKALGYVGVDTVLYSQQGNLYLLTKQFAEQGKKTVASFERIGAAADTQPAEKQ